MSSVEHEGHIREAIALAQSARANGNHPFGAVLVKNGQVILRAENTVCTAKNPTHHAEMNLVNKAWDSLSAADIEASTLYTSTEPCPMCCGAIFWSKIRRVVYSFPAVELGKIANDTFCGPCNVLFSKGGEPTEVIGPILEDEGRRVHDNFW